MPPAAARNVYVIIFDMKTQSRANSLKALSTIILYKRLSQAKDELKLYLVNTAKTTLDLPEGMFTLDANTDMETILSEIEDIDTGNTDWLNALSVAVCHLKRCFEKPGVITLKLLFITDLSSFEHPNDEKLLNRIVADLRKYDIFLYVIGPDMEPPKVILNGEGVKNWMQLLKTNEENSNVKVMKKIITATPNSVMCSYDIGMHLFNSHQYIKGMQPWQVPLSFGTTLELALSTVRISKQEPPFKLKKTSTGPTGRTASSMFKWVYEDQEDVEFDGEAIPGIVKHQKFVKIESDGMFKIDSPRSFNVLGFTSVENIPEYLLQSDGSYLVIPKDTMPENETKFFSALVDELDESNKCIIARKVYYQGINPKFVVLIPTSQYNMKCLLLCELPYADDIAHCYNEQDVKTAPRADKNQDAFAFLDSINTSEDKCNLKVPLAPAMMVDTSCLNIIEKVEEKTNIKDKILEEKFDRSNVDFKNVQDDLKNAWPMREMLNIKKEENAMDDFDEIGDFDFS